MPASGKSADSGLVLEGFLAADAALDRMRARVVELESGSTVAGVASVNGQTGVVDLTAADVGAIDDTAVVPNLTLLYENGLI